MKKLDFYQQHYKTLDEEKLFELFLDNLKPSNMNFNYFVDWNKVNDVIKDIEPELNLLNCLIGKSDFDNQLHNLLASYPKLIKVLPMLAVRINKDKKDLQQFTILVDYSQKILKFRDYDFDEYRSENFGKYVEFLDRTGIKALLKEKRIKSLVDYMLGVEAGLNSNARKNRSGLMMESICEVFIKDWCQSKDYEFITQATPKRIFEEFELTLPPSIKPRRRYDFAVRTSQKIYLIEVNFYNSTGSKLDKVVADHEQQYDLLKTSNQINFLWITDGLGWHKSKESLQEAFGKIDYVFNLKMLENNILSEF